MVYIDRFKKLEEAEERRRQEEEERARKMKEQVSVCYISQSKLLLDFNFMQYLVSITYFLYAVDFLYIYNSALFIAKK